MIQDSDIYFKTQNSKYDTEITSQKQMQTKRKPSLRLQQTSIFSDTSKNLQKQ